MLLIIVEAKNELMKLKVALEIHLKRAAGGVAKF